MSYDPTTSPAIQALGDPNNWVVFLTLGQIGATVFANFGAAIGTAKSGHGLLTASAQNPGMMFKMVVPVVMAGILGMYGLIITIILGGVCK